MTLLREGRPVMEERKTVARRLCWLLVNLALRGTVEKYSTGPVPCERESGQGTEEKRGKSGVTNAIFDPVKVKRKNTRPEGAHCMDQDPSLRTSASQLVVPKPGRTGHPFAVSG